MQIRTNLRLKTESEEQEQVLQEFKLKREKERTKLSELYSGYLSNPDTLWDRKKCPDYFRGSKPHKNDIWAGKSWCLGCPDFRES